MQGDGILKAGRITAAFGIKGWVKVFSHTDPCGNILEYHPWYLWRNGRWETVEVEEGNAHGRGVIARLAGIDNRNQAEALAGIDIGIAADQLPALPEGDFYWQDLHGLKVVNKEGVLLGVVDHLIETGANDVLVVRPCEGSVDRADRMVPWVRGAVVQGVDLEGKVVTVDWGVDW